MAGDALRRLKSSDGSAGAPSNHLLAIQTREPSCGSGVINRAFLARESPGVSLLVRSRAE